MRQLNGKGAALVALAASAAAVAMAGCKPAAEKAPETRDVSWAYPIAPPAPNPAPPVDKTTRLSLPSSTVTYTMPEVKDLFAPPDWRPQDHPPMPEVVAHGRKPDVRACGYCHLPTGDGRPENASLAGLPRQYIIEQMQAFRSGARHSSVSGRGPTTTMEAIGKAATDAEVAQAAEYFSKLQHHSFTQVVQTDTVPRTVTTGWIYSRDPAGGTEPLGQRIVEMPEDFERFEKRDPTMRYIAYVPPGSVDRGAELAKTGGSGRQACSVCHGPAYRGVGSVPGLAGRSPTMIVRQLNDFRTGARDTPAGAVMKTIASKMTDGEMIALAAFLGSREP